MKIKKLFAFALLSFITISLTACGDPTYVNFYNYDGTLLWQTPYSKNMILTYDGATPTKEKDDIYEYTFNGWNHELNEVATYKNFYAQYEKKYRSFDVKFLNYDNSLISKISVEYGKSALDHAPINPTKPNTLNEHYYFAGWGDEDLSYITRDVEVVAEYSCIECYKVEFRDYDDSILKTEYIEKGSSSNYTINKYREADDNHYYVFSNWSESPTNIQCDMIIKAVYKIVNAYTVTFKNYDGNILATDKGPDGFTAKYKGETPNKPGYSIGYYTYSFKFSNWDISLTNIKSNMTAVAQYKETYTYYNANYEKALNSIRTNAKNTSYDGDTGRYYKGFDLYVSSDKLIAGYAEVDASTDIVDLFYSLSTYKNGIWGGGSVTIFFKPHEPSEYNVYFKYVYDGATVAFGTFDIYSNFNSYTSISFNGFTNFSTVSESSYSNLAASLVKTCLTSAKTTSWIDTKNLGFTNF